MSKAWLWKQAGCFRRVFLELKSVKAAEVASESHQKADVTFAREYDFYNNEVHVRRHWKCVTSLRQLADELDKL